MGRVLIGFAVLAVYIYALMDVAQARADLVRAIPKWLWVLVLIVLGPVGPVLWFLFGRPRSGFPPPGGAGGGLGIRPRRPIAPEDDPAFLKRLDEQSWAARMERLRRERRSPDEGAADQDQDQGGSTS